MDYLLSKATIQIYHWFNLILTYIFYQLNKEIMMCRARNHNVGV